MGCADPPIRIDSYWSGPVPVATEDGLYRVQASRVGAAYLRPGVLFSDYDAVVIDPVTFSYESQPLPASGFDRTLGNYPLSPGGVHRLTRSLQQALEREMVGSEGFVVESKARPGALRISAHVVDVVWEVAPARGGETYIVHRTGVMTLVLNLRDSQSGELLGRVADRRAIRPEGAALAGGYENRSVNNWAGVREVSARWARILREALDGLHEQPRVPMSPARGGD